MFAENIFFDCIEIEIWILTDLTAVFATIDAQSGKNHTVSFHCSDLKIDLALIY